MKNNKNNITFTPNQIGPGVGSHASNPTKPLGDAHPPLNNTVILDDIKIMFAYSPKKNNAKDIEEYSVLNPETKTDSSSGRSNGCRFVSALAVTQNIKKKGNNGNTYHTAVCCACTIDVKFNVPAHKNTFTLMNPLETS